MRKNTSRAWLMTGQVSVTRQHPSAKNVVGDGNAHYLIQAAVWGKSEAVCPSGPMPKRDRIEDRHLGPLEAKAAPDVEFIFRRSFFRVELAVNTKDLLLLKGTLSSNASRVMR